MLVADIITEMEMHGVTCLANMLVRPLPNIVEEDGATFVS